MTLQTQSVHLQNARRRGDQVKSRSTLSVATLPAFLLVAHEHSVGEARSAAVFAWLFAHGFIAWSLRAQPWLNWKANAAFPAWVAAATASAGVLAFVGLLNLTPLTRGSVVIATACALIAVAIAVGGRKLLRLNKQL